MTEKSYPIFTQDDYEIVKREVLYQGFFRMAKYWVKNRLFKGGWSDTVLREIMERPSAAAVLPYDPILDKVILIEQFRIGAAVKNVGSPWLFEIIAGTFQANEIPSELAKREAKEEAGCEILDLVPICEYFVSPGGCNEYLSLFCGRVDASKAGGLFGLAEENEDIRTFVLSLDEANALLRAGKVKTSPAIIGLQWLQLNREWLKQLWQKK